MASGARLAGDIARRVTPSAGESRSHASVRAPHRVAGRNTRGLGAVGKAMTSEDRELLAHYIECGAEPWNRSTEERWYEFELRAWVAQRLPSRRPLRACNVGIGVGDWDD